MTKANPSTHSALNIVFDLDGTLIDSAPDICAMSSTVLAQWHKEGLTLQETRFFIGEGSAVFVRKMMAARNIDDNPENFDRIHQTFLSLYEEAVDRAAFNPGAWDALHRLKAHGYRLGLCTNKPEHATRAVLNHMGMTKIFDAVVAGGMLARRKPEPDMLVATIEQLGGNATIFVGDSEIDAQTAQRADVPFALYSEGYRKCAVEELHHDWRFDHFRELELIVAQHIY